MTTTPFSTEAAKEEMTSLSDAVGTKPESGEQQADKDEKIVQLWRQRFDRAEKYRKAHIDRMMRMYKLYRGYREAVNYAYGTNIMPPIGFEIVETIKPRLASASIAIMLQPTKQTFVGNKRISEWESLVDYELSVLGDQTSFDDLKVDWINAMLIYGNGVGQITWAGDENGQPYLEIVDNFLFYPDPKSTKRLLDSRWEIKQSWKDKAIIVKEEKERGTNALYKPEVLERVEDEPITKDPRTDRTDLITMMMGKINDNIKRGQTTDPEAGSSGVDKGTGEKAIEIWECWDHVENKLITIFNRTELARDDENPYKNVRNGRLFIDLPNIGINWEYYAMSILEPVETTIYEIADSRNQAMDDIVFSLDPIKKIKKGKGYKPQDMKHSPGAVWELDNVDDVKIETGPGISASWVTKDSILRTEIQTALALSEYVHGIPQSSSEPMGKVGLLLTQTNIRFSLMVRQMEIAITDLVNAMIQMNREFLGSAKEYRITGTEVEFKNFSTDAKEIELDARVDIETKPEKGPEQLANEAVSLYKTLVTEDQPAPNSAPEELAQFNKRKRAMQKLLVERFGLEKYMEELIGAEPVAKQPQPEPEQKQSSPPEKIPEITPEGIANQIPQGPEIPIGPVPVMPPEQTTSAQPPGIFQSLLNKIKGQ